MSKALVVEDSKQIQDIWKLILQQEGFSEITLLDSGALVESSVRSSRPDIVFMDINLPGDLDGINLTKLVNEIDASIPVLVLSLNDDQTTVQNALRFGARGYVVKNTSIQEIKNAMHTVLNGENYICEYLQKMYPSFKQSN
jgi:DNA-binding NarL/FixJ family response regulator